MNNQKMLDVVTMIANVIFPDKCDHESALETWLRAMKRKAREALESHEHESVTDCHAFGNAAAMREALAELCRILPDALRSCQMNGDDETAVWLALERAKAALSAPPRQCDIGDVDEQERRYRASTDEAYHTLTLTNVLKWGQKPVGNAAAMREALIVIRDALADRELDGLTEPRDILERRVVDTALAAPPRNCDVGTAEEQQERFGSFCKMDYIAQDCPDDCPLYKKDYSTMHCPFAWAQMPYAEEGGAK